VICLLNVQTPGAQTAATLMERCGGMKARSRSSSSSNSSVAVRASSVRVDDVKILEQDRNARLTAPLACNGN